MRFSLTDEQRSFAEAVGDLARRTSAPAQVRDAWKAGETTTSHLWAGLRSIGMLTLLAPEELGGGGSELELVVALEELGKAAAPGPLVEHCAVSVPLLAALAPDRLAIGVEAEEIFTAADGPLVPHVDGASAVLLLEADRVLEADTAHAVPTETLDGSRHVARLPSAAETAVVLGQGREAAEHVALAKDRAAMGTAALLIGLSARAIEMTVEYGRVRHQFGVPVGSFQAVKHQLADAHVAVEFARPIVEAAAWAISASDDEASRLCSMAKVTASKAARLAAKTALQCHGAIGYTMEADLHLYLTRIWSLLGAWGGADWHRERVATSLSL